MRYAPNHHFAHTTQKTMLKLSAVPSALKSLLGSRHQPHAKAAPDYRSHCAHRFPCHAPYCSSTPPTWAPASHSGLFPSDAISLLQTPFQTAHVDERQRNPAQIIHHLILVIFRLAIQADLPDSAQSCRNYIFKLNHVTHIIHTNATIVNIRHGVSVL